MQSQEPRRNMSSRRRKGMGLAPKVLLLAAILVGVVYFFWGEPKDETPGGNITDTTAPDSSTQSVASTDLPSLDRPGGGLVTAPPLPDLSPLNEPTPPPVKPRTVTPTPPPQIEPTPAPAPAEVEPEPEVVRAVRELAESIPAPKPFTSGADAATLYNRGDQLIADGQLVEGRSLLSRLLFADNLKLSTDDADAVRRRLNEVNRDLLWTRNITQGDTIAKAYKNDGSFLSQIGVRFRVPYQLLETINNMDARNLRADQVVKVIQGPLHARVSKTRFVMDVYAVDAEGLPVYVQSFPVGLGENTPLGNWEVIKGSKVVNPSWRDELNGEFFTSDNPENPIGEYWIAIEGLDDANRDKRGFGIHGTIEPDSIGKEESRGCIRLLDDDIAMVFNMLTDHSQGSTVQIVP
ncbi:MAG: L,D-transpeptidase family protein [Planctomycetota bacterium]